MSSRWKIWNLKCGASVWEVYTVCIQLLKLMKIMKVIKKYSHKGLLRSPNARRHCAMKYLHLKRTNVLPFLCLLGSFRAITQLSRKVVFCHLNDRLRRGYPFWHGLRGQHAKTFLNEVPLHIDLHKSLSTQPSQPTLQNWLYLIYATALSGVTHFPMDWRSACQDLSEKV